MQSRDAFSRYGESDQARTFVDISLLSPLCFSLSRFFLASLVLRPLQFWLSRTIITLGSVHRLQLLPLFDRSGRHACGITFSVPTRHGFYTAKMMLRCYHGPRDTEIVLGSDWIDACSGVFHSDEPGWDDPATIGVLAMV